MTSKQDNNENQQQKIEPERNTLLIYLVQNNIRKAQQRCREQDELG